MRDELAGRVLDRLLRWSPEEQSTWMADLRRLAAYKYDAYEGFGAGERFFESLARWLEQFPDKDDRRRLIEFVRSKLVFVSRDELNHVIACVYPDFVKHVLVRRVAEEIGAEPQRVKRVVATPEFRTLRRQTLYLGLSDGARLDRLRRASPELSHEQFWLAPELGPQTRATMIGKLAEAMQEQSLPGDAVFRHVILVDDFYGSGTSLLHRKDDGSWGGKLSRARDHLDDLRNSSPPVLEHDSHVSVVIYIASAQAERHIRDMLDLFEPSWRLLVVQRLPEELRVTDDALVALCKWFFDPALIDKHKKQSVPLGYEDAALPLVLEHNTPNNAIAPLWADSTGQESSLGRHALFPRYERHHVDRP